MAELGNTLSRARRARGITLEDAERDTHVSRRYLQALESEDFSVFPAPVYARGFLRTYSRYLGLNPDELIRVFPNGNLAVDITPLPSVARPPAQVINPNLLVFGLVAIFLLGAGLLLLNSGGEDPILSNLPVQTPAGGSATTTQGGAVQAPPVAVSPGPVQGKAISPIRPGEYPDFVGADLPSAQTVLRENQMLYVIVQQFDRNVPKDIVIRQSPGPGSKAAADSIITLYVSKGPPPQ